MYECWTKDNQAKEENSTELILSISLLTLSADLLVFSVEPQVLHCTETSTLRTAELRLCNYSTF